MHTLFKLLSQFLPFAFEVCFRVQWWSGSGGYWIHQEHCSVERALMDTLASFVSTFLCVSRGYIYIALHLV